MPSPAIAAAGRDRPDNRSSTAILPLAVGSAEAAAAARRAVREQLRHPVTVTFRLNDAPVSLEIDPRTSLLDALRDHLGMTGAKKGCDHGQCGACTVLLDGRRVLACMMLAVMAENARITTIEGLAAADGQLHPMQEAFLRHDAFQCGYCTPGQILSAVACVEEGHADSETAIRDYMSGNLCRCAAYPNIVDAIRDAADRMRGA